VGRGSQKATGEKSLRQSGPLEGCDMIRSMMEGVLGTVPREGLENNSEFDDSF
jgi:hypothetical protein